MMQRAGMTFEGYLRDGMLIKGGYVTVGIASILAPEWRNRQAQDEKRLELD